MHIRSLQEARATSRTGRVSVFSFDVFDTFLLRRCTSPDGVFERAFALAPVPAGRRGMVEAFVQQRQLAEIKARGAAVAAAGSPEVTIEEIYRRFPTRIFGLGTEDWRALTAAEFQAEQELCFANPQVAELQGELRAAGLRTGFVSDTYWTGHMLAKLLKTCAPSLEWDFLYASCDHRNGKRETLFATMLEDLGVTGEDVAHLGDNDSADVFPARRLDIHAVRYPQASPRLAALFQRENALFPLACMDNGGSRRLDGGFRTARRAIVARAPAGNPAFDYGVNVLGPVLTTFDRMVADRVAELEASGARMAVVFLARDGLAPLEVWRTVREQPAAYVEINRRIALIVGAQTVEPLADFFRNVPLVDREVAKQFLKTETPPMRRFFRHLKGGAVTGTAFADKLPELLGEVDLQELASGLRRGLLAHLRAAIPGFDDCTDLVLVDLGYAGTAQKGLRAALSQEGLPHRLHGLYLLSADEAFHDIPEHDTAEGLLSDAVMVPHAKRALLANVGVLEQMCGAAHGSVRHYLADGTPVREDDPRPIEQLALCDDIRRGAMHFAHAAASLTGFPDAFGSPEAAAWAGAVLARALLLPTDDEMMLLGSLRRDINLGSQVLMPLADPAVAAAIVGANALPAAFARHEPPAWMAASVAALSPLHGYLYALNGMRGLPADVVGEVPCGSAETVLISDNDGRAITATCLRTGFGEVRLRVPAIRNHGIHSVAVPATVLPRIGQVRSLTVQTGDTVSQAMRSTAIRALSHDSIQGMGITLNGNVYETMDSDGHLLLAVPPTDRAVTVMTLTVAPLDGNRVLALDDGSDD